MMIFESIDQLIWDGLDCIFLDEKMVISVSQSASLSVLGQSVGQSVGTGTGNNSMDDDGGEKTASVVSVG